MAQGYTKSPHDPCLFIKRDNKGHLIDFIFIYVDDGTMAYIGDSLANIIKALERKYGNIPVHTGSRHTFTGTNITHNKAAKEILLDNINHIERLATEFNLENTASSPATADLLNRNTESPLLNKSDLKAYVRLVRSIQWISQRTREDLLLPANYLSKFSSCATEEDHQHLRRLGSYLNRTKGQKKRIFCSSLNLYAMIDSSHNCHTDGKSQSALILQIGKRYRNGTGGATTIKARSTATKGVLKSSAESEIIALDEGCPDTLAAQYILQDLCQNPKTPTAYQDNKSTISMSHKGYSSTGKTKHMRIKFFWIKELLAEKRIQIEYLPTHLMTADINTKPLQGALLTHMRRRTLNHHDDNTISYTH